jgi:hypothetical protein
LIPSAVASADWDNVAFRLAWRIRLVKSFMLLNCL